MDRVWLGEVYSNMDKKLNADIAAELFNGGQADHAAWNFAGTVWFDEGVWYNEVWSHGRKKKCFSGQSLMDVIEAANDEYGSE